MKFRAAQSGLGRDAPPPRGWVTQIGPYRRVRWLHPPTVRGDGVGVLVMFYGTVNAAEEIGDGHIGGLVWLLSILGGCLLVAYSGLERIPRPGPAMIKPADLPEQARRRESR